MVDIRDYIYLSKTADSIDNSFSTPVAFKDYYQTVGSNEKNSLIRHFIVNNIPYAFKDKPILYERITQYLADKLQISPTEIKLIGSAKTGFSISPLPTYGKPFGRHSDLDFSIINEELFNKLKDEFNKWSVRFKSKQIEANNLREEFYWFQNLDSGLRQLNNGFIDTHFIPNRELFFMTRKINNSLWLIQKYLEQTHQLKVKKASASIYKSWHSFVGRLNRNTYSVMRNV